MPIFKNLSLLNVASDLKIDRRTLRVHFPNICRRIAKRRERRLALERHRRDLISRKDLNRAIQQLAAEGLPAQPVDIECHLKRPGLFNSRYARAVLDSVFTS